MAKKKSSKSKSQRVSKNFGNSPDKFRSDREYLPKRFRPVSSRERIGLTRDNFPIAKSHRDLSLAEDLRRFDPFPSNVDKFKNVDGTPALTVYKPVYEKKNLLPIYVLLIALLILEMLLLAGVEVNVNKYYSLVKFW